MLKMLFIEVYPLGELCRTGTSYMNPNSWRRKPVTFIWLFGRCNVWLLTHAESQACKYVLLLEGTYS
jgi:hypothetical protein